MASKPRSKTKTDRPAWFARALTEEHLRAPAAGRAAEVHVHLGKTNEPPRAWRAYFPHPQPGAVVRTADTPDGVKILVSPLVAVEIERDPRLKATPFTRVRDAVGQATQLIERLEVAHAAFDFALPAAHLPAAVAGVEIALYRYKRLAHAYAPKFGLSFAHEGRPLADLGPGLALGRAVNMARHLVNLPPNELNPVAYAKLIPRAFAGRPHVTVEVWDETRLARERCGLHLAVGVGSVTPPRLVKVSYRPPKVKSAPVALVGKGITFDSGGLDIKPANGMRLMKKDMGGSAAVLGAIHWASAVNLPVAIDAYVALAENSISDRAFRPGDVFTARSGMTVEIHNTDAEGRLVLADAMDVAITATPRPRALVDLATLTGAIKVALGANLAGLFATDDALSAALAKAGANVGDLTWTMPLVQRYRAQSNSNFADCVNSVDGFGGAITAALFLEKFAGDVPWAHLDIYAWKDGVEGAWAEPGGSGQGVGLLTEWLKTLAD